ncbi:(2Fe-2S)-binding protein [Actinoplanes sp. Pm04-4]|uniref:(2Fe-2S)-binding protein n=1 Tax=Paractinoplanes pyxinae TaxID=2997416 RepID=A0ABT4AXW1_9ACTN|nr:(2Fe-2S)-binding protein [Actinoplanes pyxinae]MCY1139084.1 (2Fe-2S)-binding protein [Actinoplanes pyxinae]
MTTTGPAGLEPHRDPVRPRPAASITLVVDGVPVPGVDGQTVAGVLMGAGRLTWRTTRHGRPRGVFCGIGVCHDCLVTVNGLPDVRACQRRAADGDTISTEEQA